MKVRVSILALAAVACLSSTARAQQTAEAPPVSATPDSSAAPRAANPSSIDQPSVAVRRNAPAATAPMPQERANLGRPKALMLVGAAAFVTGALIGDDIGTIFMVGGGIIGLYGLWQYLQ